MTADGVDDVVSIFLQKTGNYKKAQEAAPYMYPNSLTDQSEAKNQHQKKPLYKNQKSNEVYENTGTIDFKKLPYMEPKEVDKLAIDYMNATGEFQYIYNLRQFMTQEGIDKAVFLYVRTTKDYGLVGAMLQFMSKDASRTLAKEYYRDADSTEYDWIYKPYQ